MSRNFCKKELKKEHKGHEIVEINPKDEQYKKYSNIIETINEELKAIIEFNKLVLNTGERFKNNYFHLKSIINLGRSLREENKRDSKDIKCLLSDLNKNIENSSKAIDILIDKKSLQLSRCDKYINLNKRELDDQDFKYISQINFNQLKEIDISENDISNIELFNKMSLPFLEFLNLSHNKIEIIEPITKLKSKNLQYIFLQNNKIKDIYIFLESDFRNLQILRIEENNIYEENEEKRIKRERTLKLIKKKYLESFIYKSINEQIKDFKKNYNLDKEISGDDKIIELKDIYCGDKILKDLFLIITYKAKNNINKLILRNNKIKDPSILNRINFNKLEILDLTANEITNLKFLSDMKAKYLKYLYLDNNNFNDIYPLFNSNFPNLELLSLNRNGDIQSEIKRNLNEERLIKLIKKDGFICPKCEELIALILNLHVDNKKIDFQCKRCGKFEFLSMYYLSELTKNNYLYTKCYYCNAISEGNEDNFLYCYDCKKDFCNICFENHKNQFYEHIKIIIVNEKKNRCLEHYDETIQKFCFDCEENICERLVSVHKNHKIIRFENLNKDFLESLEIIKKKNRELSNIIKFNKTIIKFFLL